MTTRQSRLIAVLAAAALAGGVLAGCAQDGENGAAPGGSVSATPSSPGPSNLSPSGPLSPSGGPIGGGKSANGEMTLTGDLEEGVEAGCTLLRAGTQTYLLLGADREVIRQGGRVTVRGKPQPGLMTTCQQGTPFQVSDIRRA
jgi:hypothetical protein